MDNFILDNFDAEANYMLASVEPKEHNKLTAKYNAMRNIIVELQNSIIDSKIILKDVSKFIQTGVLDYLTLKDDEFVPDPILEGICRNKRYPAITKENGKIYYKHAYFIEFTKLYHNEFKTISEDNHIKRVSSNKIYIQDGGYISNKYFKDVIIRPECVGLFAIQSKIVLPINRLFDTLDNEIYFINKNNPKFKALKEFYDIPIYEDPNMLDKNGLAIYNIRNFKQI